MKAKLLLNRATMQEAETMIQEMGYDMSQVRFELIGSIKNPKDLTGQELSVYNVFLKEDKKTNETLILEG